MNARQRIDFIADTGSFCEMDADLRAKDVIHFPGYDKKLKHARLASGEKEAVVCGTAAIGGENCALFVMEPSFMMGSMGTVVGEKVTRLFEYEMCIRDRFNSGSFPYSLKKETVDPSLFYR